MERIEQYRPDFGPGIRERIAFAAAINADQVALAGQVRARVKARLAGYSPTRYSVGRRSDSSNSRSWRPIFCWR